MKPIPFNSYRLSCIAIVIVFIACTYAVRHFAAIDGQLFQCSMRLVFGDAVFLTPGSLPAADLAQLRSAGRFSYHHVAIVSALVTYLCIVLYGTHKWFKVLFIVAALAVPFSCIYMGTLLPFGALAAILIGILTTAAVGPIYVQHILLTKPTV